MPPRSRTKPGSTTRRPKVAGLRQHAHAGPAARHPGGDPDAVGALGDPEVFDTTTVDDVDATTAAVPQVPEAPADGSDARTGPDASGDSAPAAETRDPDESDGAATATASAVTDTADTPTAAPDSTGDAPTDVTADAPEHRSADPDPDPDSTTDTAADAATTTTAPHRSRRGRGRDGMGRREATATPTRERPARGGGRKRATEDADTTTATPTRTAKPARTGGRGTGEAAPAAGRLAPVRAGLARFAGSRALPVVLAVFVVVCLVLSGLAFWQGRQAWTDGPISNDAVVDVGSTAELVGQSREAVEKIFSYDFTRLDESADAARTMSTGQFTDRYLSVFDQTIRQPALQQQLRQTASVVNIGVMTMRDDRAEVMALVQFSAQRTATGQSTNAPGLLRLQMERADGRWKLAELTPLAATPGAPR